MKTYTIIAGVNGTGKSSFTGALKAEKNDLGLIIDVDKLNVKYDNPLVAARHAIKMINDCIVNGISFTQETTLSGAKTRKTIIKAKEKGYSIRLYYIGLNTADDSMERIKNRVSKGGHDIPPEDVYKRYKSRYADLIKILPYCNEAKFFDNNNGFVEVAEYKNGELLLLGDYRPKWITELKDRLSNI